MLKFTSLAVLAATGSAAPHVRSSDTLTATTDTALLEEQNWFGGAFGSIQRVFTGHTAKQDDYTTAKLDFALGSENVQEIKKNTFDADAACTVAEGHLQQIIEANTKTKKTTESAEALREKKRLQVEQADAAVVTASEGHEESKSATEKAMRKAAATKQVAAVKSEEHIGATQDFDVAGKKVDDSKADVVDLEAKIAAIQRKQKEAEQNAKEQTPMAGLAKITETALIERSGSGSVEEPKQEEKQHPVEEPKQEEKQHPVKEPKQEEKQHPVKEPKQEEEEQHPVEEPEDQQVEDLAATLAATKKAHTNAQKDVKTAMEQEHTAEGKKMKTKEELEEAKTKQTDASKTLAASEETEKKAAIKKEVAQTNADHIKNSDDGIDAQEAAEQQMKQEEADAREVAEQKCKVKQESEQLLEEAEKELLRLEALLTEKRIAYNNEKAAALKTVTDGIAEAERKAAVAEGEEQETATAITQKENAKEEHTVKEQQELDELTKKKADARQSKIDQQILAADGNIKVAKLEKMELVESSQEPIDPGYVAPKKAVEAVQEPTVPVVAPEVGGASRQQLRGN